MSILFEYGNRETFKNRVELEKVVQDIWQTRKTNVENPELSMEDSEQSEEEPDPKYQPFLRFDGENVSAKNYVGFIQNGEDIIEIYPKVFREQFQKQETISKENKQLMLRHIFYWFKYCRKWKFPFNQASLGNIDIDEFPELIINLIANQFLETVSNQPLMMYQAVEESLVVPRGSINFKRYISKSLSYGNFQNIECDYEPFLFDNKVNRLIKFCSRLLMNHTKFPESFRVLQEVVFILDEVEDVYCTIHDLESITLNSFFSEYSILLDSCKLILNQQLYANNSYDLTQWCLLFPMEYIFEDFVAGFLEDKFSRDWKVDYQKSDMYLSEDPEAFNMQHDIFLTSRQKPERKVIIDTKYKLRPKDFKNDIKKGIAQSDLYQMVSYAFKRGCTDVLLIYPNISDKLNLADTFIINSGFNGEGEIKVTAIEIPFYSLNNFENLDLIMYKVIEEQLNSHKKIITTEPNLMGGND